jgi:hypothetical protein
LRRTELIFAKKKRTQNVSGSGNVNNREQRNARQQALRVSVITEAGMRAQ